MSIERKLRQWQEAGLLDAATVDRIRAHEEQSAKPIGSYAVAGIGAVAVATGIVAIVASNWDAIPASAKIGVDVVVLAALGASVMRTAVSGPRWLCDALILIEYGVVLASVGLVAQIYQLGGATYTALCVWTALATPLVFHGSGRFLAVAWVVGTQATLVSILVELAETPRFDGLAVTLCHAIAGLTLLAGSSAYLSTRKPAFARALREFGLLEVALSASFGTAGFYEGFHLGEHPASWWGVAVSALATAGLIVQVGRKSAPSNEWSPPAAVFPARITIAAALVLAQAPLFLHGDTKLDVLAALTFVAFWALVGWTAFRARTPRIVNLATAFVALRILIAYFEVFGTLLNTGIGLVIGGALVLGLTYVWVKYKRGVDRRLIGGRNES